ncbi:coiled-coil domain-containing protein 60 isoform X6 [Symphalangus syndactylus]|uniref:coiled-coil domain-containing protein 60 isoform X6 n=1 Tax=Symphalangus syndactylus TaxID=9590 RepID=UPI00244179B7|nr:coiled-coil domain-containing protein 60 isoform X5 [Symphalangus syndactylus]
MTKVPATKKLQSSPNEGAVRPFYASENLRQVPDKPMKSIKYMDKEIINLKKDLIRSRTYDDEKLKTLGARVTRRPFTPIHSCIISPSLPEAHVDPGGSKSTVKKINKDKSMGQKWEHFVTAPKTKKFKIPTMRVTNRKPSRRGSTLSLSRASGGSSPQSSMISVNPGSDEPPSVNTQVTSSKDIEDNESSSTKPDEEPLYMNLQKLLEMVREDARRTVTIENGMQRKAPSILSVLKQNKSNSAYNEMQTTRKSSERSSSTSAESHIQPVQKKSKNRTNCDINIRYKSGVCNTMRAKFYSVAQEAGFCLQDKMEILMKRQEDRGIQKFRAFVLVSNFQKDIAKMRHHISVVKGDAEETADHWYFDLLSKLPEDLKNFRPAKKILVKLQKFGENLDLRIRPHVLLKVLQDLRIWELCSPDIAVAIEFVREHIIHMPQEDYISWLQSRINIPIGPYSALR